MKCRFDSSRFIPSAFVSAFLPSTHPHLGRPLLANPFICCRLIKVCSVDSMTLFCTPELHRQLPSRISTWRTSTWVPLLSCALRTSSGLLHSLTHSYFPAFDCLHCCRSMSELGDRTSYFSNYFMGGQDAATNIYHNLPSTAEVSLHS